MLPVRLAYAFDIANVRAGMTVLDAGFGRGEMLLHCCRAGARVFGIDYSQSAIELARETLGNTPACDLSGASVARADVKCLPFTDGFFDRIFVLDVVEHLHRWELDNALREFYRVLAPNGKIIIHTMPNRWYYAVGYPLYRSIQRLRGMRLPSDPRQRWKFVPSVHVNEQDPISLRSALNRANFSAKVWLQPTWSGDEENSVEGRIKGFLSSVFPLKLVFCSSIFAIAERKVAKKARSSAD